MWPSFNKTPCYIKRPIIMVEIELLSGREVPFDFIAKAVENGCEYLDLVSTWVKGFKKSELPWKLKYLEISQYCDQKWAREDLDGVLQNCHFLQKLAVDDLILNSNEIEHICQNGNTLRILSLDTCNINGNHRSELIKKLLTSCPQLTELNLQDYRRSGTTRHNWK